ncbi:hypothetical protein VPNG_01428 [Cytospora leucostoma]|uniref:O-methyltransferase C-terminal domain-containing protein n=1 Tax=Cytospora leucostoma TaxID=1230097 RepID=A0A423XKH1_9PEZI|nr:hypothetical protein VPNG_01428 [Cytospora leucostoma]
MAFNASTTRLTQLATHILESVAELEEKLSNQGFPSPTFNEDAPALLPKDTVQVRDSIIDAAAEVQDLLQGPLDIIFRHGSAISRFNIASLVPSGGQTTFAEIAKKTGLEEGTICRTLRHAMTMRVFREPEPGVVAHTQASRALMDPVANDWMGCGTEEMWPASTRMVDAMEKWPGTQEPNETAFALANGTEESIYQVLGASPERAHRFANCMKAYMGMQEYNASHVVNNYDWKSLGPVKIVDVGGGAGHVTMELAKAFPSLSIVVQDMEKMVEEANANIPADLKDRFEFMVQDIFAPQTVQADVYFIRWVFHNWSDKYCALILKALIPALKPGARIIINETCMPEPAFASHERSLDEWKALLAEVDPRFVFQTVKESIDSALAVMEFIWTQD